MALPEGASASVPEPTIKPTLESPLYSEAIGFTAYPNEWLPFTGAKTAMVFEGSKPIGWLSAGAADEFTPSLVTTESKQVRYALNIGHGWSVEQDIEVATSDSEIEAEEQDGEGSND